MLQHRMVRIEFIGSDKLSSIRKVRFRKSFAIMPHIFYNALVWLVKGYDQLYQRLMF